MKLPFFSSKTPKDPRSSAHHSELIEKIIDQADEHSLQKTIDVAVRMVHADKGILFVCNPDSRTLHVKVSSGFSKEFLEHVRPIPIGVAASGAAYEKRESVIVEDTEKDKLFASYKDEARQVGFRAIYATPLVTRERQVLGVLTVHFKEPHRPSNDEIDLMESYVRQTVDLLEGAWLRYKLTQELAEKGISEEFLAAKEKELSLITGITPTMLVRCDKDLRFKFVNSAYAAHVGMRPEDIIGKYIPDIVGQAAFSVAKPYMDQVLQGKKVEYEAEMPYKDGGVLKYLHVIYAPEFNDQEDVIGFVGSITDVTEKHKSEYTMRHQSAIVESSQDAIISKSLDGTITSWNKGAEQLFGYTADEIIGKSIFTLIPPERQHEEETIVSTLKKGIRIDHFETIRLHKNGTPINISLTVSPIKDANGQIIGASKISRDVTAQKKSEAELKKINQELVDLTLNLEQRVNERTQKLEEQSEQLRRLAVELTEAEESERKHLAQILHDHLQQLLVAAKMRIELMQRKEKDLKDPNALSEIRSFIEKAFESSRSLTAELRPPVLYEGGLIPALRFLARKFQDQYKLQVNLDASPQAEPASNFLRVMIYSSVQEILFNTVKYAGVSECFVNVHRMDNGHICIVIRDEGVGFNTEVIGRKGSEGFGLFSIRERMRALGGEFKIESSVGEGTKFVINIPDNIQEAKEIEEAKQIEAIDHQRKKAEGLSVLLADDHKIVRQALANLLLSQPFIGEVIEAEDGQDVVDKARYTNPDVILMDLNMPRLNGIEAARIIHQNHPHIRIIGLSVQTEPETMQAMKDAGAIGYFHKGEETDVLIETLRRFSKNSEALT